MKKLMLIAALGAAAIFTACGDDSSSSAGGSGGKTSDPLKGKAAVSCDMVSKFGGVESHTCTAVAADDPAAEGLKAGCAAVEGMPITNTVGEGCADGAELVCQVENTVQYFYDQGVGGFSCEQMANNNK